MVIHDRKGQNSEGHAPQRLTQRLDRAQQTTNHTQQHARRSARCWPACSYVARGVGATSPLARVVAAGFDSRPGLLDVIIRVHLSVGFSLVPYVYVCCHGLLLLARSRSTASRSSTLCGSSLVAGFPAGSARRDHPRPPQRRLLARTVRPRPGATVYGFSVLHALRLLGPPRSAAPRSSTLCCSSPVHGRRTLLLARTRPAAPRSYTPCGSPLVHALRLLARPRSAAPRSSTLCGCVALVVVHGPGVVRRRMRSPRPWGPGFQWRGASAAFCVLLGVPSLDAR